MVFLSDMLKRFKLLFASLGVLLLGVAWAGAQSTRPGWGAVPYADANGTGVTFRVWAPNADAVAVFGDFVGGMAEAIPLLQETPVSQGIWSVDVPTATVGDRYWYRINADHVRRDPRARQVVHSQDAGVIYDPNAYWWETREFIPPPQEELVIYEMHIGTFNKPESGGGAVGTFARAIERLDDVALLGVNAVKVMPVAQFPGDHSWGYNPSDPFAVESAYGGPDGFKAFVDACHARGLAVILDVVHNHYGPVDLDYSLRTFDGWPGALGSGIYFYQDPAKAETPWGPRPDFSRPEVRAYIRDNIRMWIEEYRVDGFRWDATLYIRYDTNFNVIPEGETLLREIGEMMAMEFPEKYHIAEDLRDSARVTAPWTDPNGLGFQMQWDKSFHQDVVGELTAAAGPDVEVIAAQMRVTNGLQRVVYTESHDEVGYLNVPEGAQRFTARVDAADPFGYAARKRTLLGAALVMTAPGVPMLFQGQEMLENELFSTTNAMDWAKADTYRPIVNAHRDLAHLRRNLHRVSGGLSGSLSAASVTNNGTMLLVHRGVEGLPDDDVFVIANFSDDPAEGIWIDFPHAGTWYTHFNSDDPAYSPDFAGVGSETVFAFPDLRGNPYVAPWSVLILSQHPPGPLDSDRDGIPDAWEILNGLDPNDPTDAWLSLDGDALTNLEEYWAGTNPNEWNLPPSTYATMAIAGSFNNWSTAETPMVLIAPGLWQRDLEIPASTQNIQFKFAANDSWDTNYGGLNQTRYLTPITWPAIEEGENIVLTDIPPGTYRFRFDEYRRRFTVRPVAVADSDNDGIPDAWEIEHGLNPFSSHDALLRPDGDLYTHLEKFRYGLTPGEYAPPLTDYEGVGIIFDFNGFDPGDMNMTQATDAHYTWVLVTNLFRPQGASFKIAADGSWDVSWGDWHPDGTALPLAGLAERDGPDIEISEPLAGNYRFTFNEQTGAYTVELDGEPWQPPTYASMAVAANFNGWNTTPNMVSNALHEWTYTAVNIVQSDDLAFKFAANDTGFETSWGAGAAAPSGYPATGEAEWGGAENMVVPGPMLGTYTFFFNSLSGEFSVTEERRTFGGMAVAGDFNGWNTTPNMTPQGDHVWVLTTNIMTTSTLTFKFAADDGWAIQWGGPATHAAAFPVSGTARLGAGMGEDIVLTNPLPGAYTITFNSETFAYTIDRQPLPARYTEMAVAGNFNGWDTTSTMTLNADQEWVFETPLEQGGALEFKFVSGGGWQHPNWGDSITHSAIFPVTGTGVLSGDNITVPGPFSGAYRFTFNDHSLTYRMEPVAAGFRMMAPESMAGAGLILRWESEHGRTYRVEWIDDLREPAVNGYAAGLPATPPMNVYTADVPASVSSRFYRIHEE